jgi:NADH-quinone oxidoreductase subunit C
MENLISLKGYLEDRLKKKILGTSMAFGELTLEVAPDHLLEVLAFLRDDLACSFSQLIDVCGVDWLGRRERFDVVYHLLSVHKNHRIRVRVSVGEGQGVPTATNLFKAAGWWERETWDMYGIPFEGHVDLRRILTDYGFEGFPLRKDFPLSGHYQVRYDEASRKVIREPVKLQQAYRTFDFEMPWEGTQTVLPEGTPSEGAKNG